MMSRTVTATKSSMGVDTEGLEVAGVLKREAGLVFGWAVHGRRVLVSLCLWAWYVLERVW